VLFEHLTGHDINTSNSKSIEDLTLLLSVFALLVSRGS